MGIIDRIRAAFARPEKSEESPGDTEELWSPEMGQDYRRFWDNMARDRAGAYLAVAGEPFGSPATEESLSAHGRDTAAIISRVLDIGGSDRVLEVGVGVGRIAEHVAPLCASFTGMDISENMIGIARQRLARFSNVELHSHPKSDLSLFADSTFDRVYFQVVLIHLDREDAFNYMREALRVLKPGGLAWFQFYNLLHPGGFKEFKFAVDYMVEKGGKTRGRVHCYTALEVRHLVTAAGFRIREERSWLELAEQKFSFEIPDTDWEYYLIATGEKPGDV